MPVDLVLDVQDPFCPWNTGRHRLRAEGENVSCEPTSAPADLRMTAAEPGAAFLGGSTPAALAAADLAAAGLAAAGLVEELRPGALRLASAAFRGEREPWYPGGWASPLY